MGEAEAIPSFGTVLDVAGNRLRVWVSGVTGPDGVWMPVPQDAPAWLTEKGRDFRVSGDLGSLETATYSLHEADELERYRNALTWVRHVAGLHYLGGAFDPEHMRDLANLATAALQGKDFPDYEEAMARGRQEAAKYAALFGALADDPEGGDGP